MIINNYGISALNINSSFSSRRVGEDQIRTENGVVIGSSGNPVLLEPESVEKTYSSESFYFNFKTNPENGEINETPIIRKSEFDFRDNLFHNPVLVFKDNKSAGINSDIIHNQPDYGNLNVQIIEELEDDPNRFIVKISDFDNYYNNGEKKLYLEDYVAKGDGIKILVIKKTLNDEGVYRNGNLQLVASLNQSEIDSQTTSYFVPIASIDTDRVDFTVLY